jgi:hypothetical protein
MILEIGESPEMHPLQDMEAEIHGVRDCSKLP